MTLNVTGLENFLLVAAHGSFSRAASIAGIAQPALGRQIQKLEAECGCRLFYRHGRGVVLTAEGERYRQRIEPLIRQLRAARLDLEVDREVAGSVIVGMTPTVVELIGLPLLAAVHRDHPGVQVNVVSGYSGYVHEWLIDGRLDIAILHDAKRSRQISFDPLAEAELFLVSAPGSLSKTERNASAVALPKLRGYKLALPTRNHGLRRTLEFAASDAGVPLQVEYQIDTLPLMKNLVLNGLAHTVLALPAVASDVRASRLIARRIVDPTVSTTLGVATATNRPLTRATQLILAVIRQELERAIRGGQMNLCVRLLQAR